MIHLNVRVTVVLAGDLPPHYSRDGTQKWRYFVRATWTLSLLIMLSLALTMLWPATLV